MASERYNGMKINMDRATDDEVMGVLDHSLERLHRAEEDVQRAMGHASARGLIKGRPEYSDNVVEFPVQSLQLEIEYEGGTH